MRHYSTPKGFGAQASALTLAQVQAMITAAAQQYGVSPSLALAVAQTESGFNTNAVSPTNANGTTDYGVFQINTANLAAYGLTANPLDPQSNIDAGVQMLASLSSQYGGDTSSILWAYNAGPGSVASGSIPASTANYVSSVQAAMANFGGGLPSISFPDLSSIDLSSLSDSAADALGIDPDWFPWIAGGVALAALWWAVS